MLTDAMKRELVARIKAAERVDKILLFGSEAIGAAGPDSDIDLLMVLDRETMPATFQERSANYLQILLRWLNSQIRPHRQFWDVGNNCAHAPVGFAVFA